MWSWLPAYLFDELWAIVWRNGLFVGVIILLVAYALLSPALFFPRTKPLALWLALGLFLILGSYDWGVYNGEARGKAIVQDKWDAANAADAAATAKARRSAESMYPLDRRAHADRLRPNDPWDRDQPAQNSAPGVRPAAALLGGKRQR